MKLVLSICDYEQLLLIIFNINRQTTVQEQLLVLPIVVMVFYHSQSILFSANSYVPMSTSLQPNHVAYVPTTSPHGIVVILVTLCAGHKGFH